MSKRFNANDGRGSLHSLTIVFDAAALWNSGWRNKIYARKE
jgi:hypothetical protein